MSYPVEFDFVLLKLGDGETVETFTTVCGLQDATINESTSVEERGVRDCAAPGSVPFRKTKATRRQLDITGTGLTDAVGLPTLQAANGQLKNWRAELYRDDGTDAGTLLGTYAGSFRMTAHNMSIPREGQASAEINLASEGAWTYTDAPGS